MRMAFLCAQVVLLALFYMATPLMANTTTRPTNELLCMFYNGTSFQKSSRNAEYKELVKIIENYGYKDTYSHAVSQADLSETSFRWRLKSLARELTQGSQGSTTEEWKTKIQEKIESEIVKKRGKPARFDIRSMRLNDPARAELYGYARVVAKKRGDVIDLVYGFCLALFPEHLKENSAKADLARRIHQYGNVPGGLQIYTEEDVERDNPLMEHMISQVVRQMRNDGHKCISQSSGDRTSINPATVVGAAIVMLLSI